MFEIDASFMKLIRYFSHTTPTYINTNVPWNCRCLAFVCRCCFQHITPKTQQNVGISNNSSVFFCEFIQTLPCIRVNRVRSQENSFPPIDFSANSMSDWEKFEEGLSDQHIKFSFHYRFFFALAQLLDRCGSSQ